MRRVDCGTGSRGGGLSCRSAAAGDWRGRFGHADRASAFRRSRRRAVYEQLRALLEDALSPAAGSRNRPPDHRHQRIEGRGINVDTPGDRLRFKLDLVYPALGAYAAQIWSSPRVRELYPAYLGAMHQIVRSAVQIGRASCRERVYIPAVAAA